MVDDDNVIEIVGYRTEEPLPEDHFAIDGYKAEVLLSSDTFDYLQKMNTLITEEEIIWFKEVVECRYDPETGEEFNVST